MKKVVEVGMDFVTKEYWQIEGFVDAGKVSKEKIHLLKKKFNILLRFRQFQMKQKHLANMAAMNIEADLARASGTGKEL